MFRKAFESKPWKIKVAKKKHISVFIKESGNPIYLREENRGEKRWTKGGYWWRRGEKGKDHVEKANDLEVNEEKDV